MVNWIRYPTASSILTVLHNSSPENVSIIMKKATNLKLTFQRTKGYGIHARFVELKRVGLILKECY